jgi:hypothetical protein
VTRKHFFQAVTSGGEDVIGRFVRALEEESASWCVIGGLAVNAYADPLVSLDLDVVVVVANRDALVERLRKTFAVREFPNSLNLEYPGADLRIQIQRDPRYDAFVTRAVVRPVLGHDLSVAAIEDVLQGKVWAASDATRRASKRQKDLLDILRLVETEPRLAALVPESIRALLP